VTRLQKLEGERVARMNGIELNQDVLFKGKKIKGKSEKVVREPTADDLGYDQFQVEEEIKPLTYKDGVLVNKNIFMKPPSDLGSDEDDEDEEVSGDEDDDDEEVSGDDDDVSENVSASSGSGTIAGNQDNEEIGFNSDEDNEYLKKYPAMSGREEVDGSESSESGSETDMIEEEVDVSELDEIEIKEREEASKELPFTFDAPETYEDLKTVFNGWSIENQLTIIERIIILNNPKLGLECRDNLERFMNILLQHYETVSSSAPFDMDYIKGIEMHLIGLCRQCSMAFAILSKEKIIKLSNSLNKAIRSSLNRRTSMASFPTLLFFKLLTNVFSTSDLFHLVISPAMLLMSQYISQSHILTAQDLMSGLFICELLYEVNILFN
jgi:nucleolar protein 14